MAAAPGRESHPFRPGHHTSGSLGLFPELLTPCSTCPSVVSSASALSAHNPGCGVSRAKISGADQPIEQHTD